MTNKQIEEYQNKIKIAMSPPEGIEIDSSLLRKWYFVLCIRFNIFLNEIKRNSK
jgi:hypothetical protein